MSSEPQIGKYSRVHIQLGVPIEAALVDWIAKIANPMITISLFKPIVRNLLNLIELQVNISRSNLIESISFVFEELASL